MKGKDIVFTYLNKTNKNFLRLTFCITNHVSWKPFEEGQNLKIKKKIIKGKTQT